MHFALISAPLEIRSEAILKLFQFEVGGVLKNMEQTDGIYEDVVFSYLSREKWSKRNNS